MTITIIGTPDSGKSKKAEDIVCRFSDPSERIYIATMLPYGEEGKKRVEKHRRMREGKGFLTIEQPYDVAEALDRVPSPETATVLLECISNLAANELFGREYTDLRALPAKIIADVKCIQTAVKNLIIVSNHFNEEDASDNETIGYIHTMDDINRKLQDISDKCVLL